MVRIFSDRIWDRIRLEGFRSVRIRVRIFNIRYRICIRILKSYICDVDIQSYLIRHGWHYPYSNPNPTKNMKTNMISVISVRIRSVFIPTNQHEYKIVKIHKSTTDINLYLYYIKLVISSFLSTCYSVILRENPTCCFAPVTKIAVSISSCAWLGGGCLYQDYASSMEMVECVQQI